MQAIIFAAFRGPTSRYPALSLKRSPRANWWSFKRVQLSEMRLREIGSADEFIVELQQASSGQALPAGSRLPATAACGNSVDCPRILDLYTHCVVWFRNELKA